MQSCPFTKKHSLTSYRPYTDCKSWLTVFVIFNNLDKHRSRFIKMTMFVFQNYRSTFHLKVSTEIECCQKENKLKFGWFYQRTIYTLNNTRKQCMVHKMPFDQTGRPCPTFLIFFVCSKMQSMQTRTISDCSSSTLNNSFMFDITADYSELFCWHFRLPFFMDDHFI